jgi:hypothetical protein
MGRVVNGPVNYEGMCICSTLTCFSFTFYTLGKKMRMIIIIRVDLRDGEYAQY